MTHAMLSKHTNFQPTEAVASKFPKKPVSHGFAYSRKKYLEKHPVENNILTSEMYLWSRICTTKPSVVHIGNLIATVSDTPQNTRQSRQSDEFDDADARGSLLSSLDSQGNKPKAKTD